MSVRSIAWLALGPAIALLPVTSVVAEEGERLLDDVPEIVLDAEPVQVRPDAEPDSPAFGLEALGLQPGAGPDRRPLSEVERQKLAIRAEAGEVISQVRLARALKDGSRGFETDPDAAFHWFLQAAREGNLEAQLNVASMYYAGFGIRTAPAHAFLWFSRAAERGHPTAEMAVGEMYYYGIGTEQDYRQAFNWLRRAAERGEPSAQYRVGMMYREGNGVSESRFQAYLWLHLATITADGELYEAAFAERAAIDEEFTEAERLGAMLVSREYEQMFVDPALVQLRREEEAAEEAEDPPGDPSGLPDPAYESPVRFD